MNIHKANNQMTSLHKEFWDSLRSDILISNQNINFEDLAYHIEKNYMFSLFFRGTSYKDYYLEVTGFKNIFHLKDSGYLIVLEILPEDKPNLFDFAIDEYEFYHFLKGVLSEYYVINTIGPIISNRISILISEDHPSVTGKDTKKDSITITRLLVEAVRNEFHVSTIAGIGNTQNLQSIYTSFIEAMSCMHRCQPGDILHVKDLVTMEQDYQYEYREAEKHMLEAIRLRKAEAYDYFIMMLNYIEQLNDDVKRNMILEALVLAAHAAKMDRENETDYFNYTSQLPKLLEYKGEQLIEWAYQRFMYITGFMKPQVSIDYSNKIVQATREYLEAHYSEEISLEDVAEYVNISPQYFSKLIKKNTGFNFIDWLSMLRVKKAKELLTNSNYTVKEVCFMVGYKDPNYFSRIFKKKLGITPSEFVKNRSYVNNKS